MRTESHARARAGFAIVGAVVVAALALLTTATVGCASRLAIADLILQIRLYASAAACRNARE